MVDVTGMVGFDSNNTYCKQVLFNGLIISSTSLVLSLDVLVQLFGGEASKAL